MLASFCHLAKHKNKQAKIHLLFKIILRFAQAGGLSMYNHLPPLTLNL